MEVFEQNISKLESVIQKKKIEYNVVEETTSYWQKKRDCARTSLESTTLARDINKKTINELDTELKKIAKKLEELMKVSDQDTIELSNSQVVY